MGINRIGEQYGNSKIPVFVKKVLNETEYTGKSVSEVLDNPEFEKEKNDMIIELIGGDHIDGKNIEADDFEINENMTREDIYNKLIENYLKSGSVGCILEYFENDDDEGNIKILNFINNYVDKIDNDRYREFLYENIIIYIY